MADDFSRHIARVVSSQIAEGTGFDACQDSAIEILGDLLLRYLATLCSNSHSYAELAGRSQSNLSDVLLALEDLGVTPEDLYQHMQLQGTDVPFAHTLTQYPVHKQQALPPTFAERKESHPDHIPPFLPAFPDPHTYQHTAAYAGHQTDPHKQRQSMLEAKQKSEAALHKLHQRISSKPDSADANPFLTTPNVEQLPLQVPTLPTAAAAAAAAVTVTAAADGTTNQPMTELRCLDAVSGADGIAVKQETSATAGIHADHLHASASTPQRAQQQQQGLVIPLSLTQVQYSKAEGAAADGADESLLDEDVLFESAAVLKAFSSILPAEVLRQHTEHLQGSNADEQQQQDQQPLVRSSSGVDDLDTVVEEGVSPMDTDTAPVVAGSAADAMQNWLAWDDTHQQQQQQRPSDLLGPSGAAGPKLLCFGIDPLAAGKSTALRLAGKQRPPDAFAERSSQKGAGASAMVSGSGRQRKSKYDADPAKQRAEGILAANPEALYATAADGRQIEIFADMDEDV